MYDAFISYRRKNGFAIAKMLRELLKTKGITSFMDLDELRSGTFDDKLLAAIQATPSFILILPPGALDRCGEEDDWLTKEIITAIDSGRNIIPVLCDGFEWPKQWNGAVPEKIRLLANYNSVIMSYEYIDAMVDKVIDHIRDNGSAIAEKKESRTQPATDIDSFFRNRMQDMGKIKGIDLAFHAGSEWHENIDRLDILTDLADAGVQIRVIINSPAAAESIGKYMRHKRKRYVPFTEAVQLWKDFDEAYENVEVRVSEIPLLRIYYAFRMEEPSEDVVRVKYYTYGNAKINRNYSQNFESTDSHFGLYKAEFDFLWSNAEPAEQFEL